MYFNNAPGIAKLYETVIPALGHDSSGAFMDLLDNSDDAGASRMEIKILSEGRAPIGYAIIDNGIGMDQTTLVESYRFATTSPHVAGDLGKFGVGGTIASFTMANKKTTITKTINGEILVAEQDLRWFDDPDHDALRSCMIRKPTEEEIKQFTKLCGKHGTIVLLTDLKKQQFTRAGDLKNRLLKDIGLVFHQKLGSNKKIFITHRNKKYEVRPKDPLHSDSGDKLIYKHVQDVDFNGHKITIKMVQINLDKFDQSERTYGQQGLYINRNGRLIMQGIAHPLLWKKNPRMNAGRVEISFSEELDEDFGLVATKNNIDLKQELQDTLWNEGSIKQFRKRLDQMHKRSKPTNSQQISKEESSFSDALLSNAGVIDLPKHPLAPAVTKPSDKSNSSSKKSNSKDNAVKQKPKRRMVPKFTMEEHFRVKQHFWIEGFDDGHMTIVINTANEFIKEYYVNGNSDTKRALRIEWAAQALSEWSFWDTDEWNPVVAHRERTSEKITKIHNTIN